MKISLESLIVIFSENNKFAKYSLSLRTTWGKGTNGEIDFIIVMICF